ncbi:hypothetical protein PoHVEF18_002112 [Penicillium ochrochloron]
MAEEQKSAANVAAEQDVQNVLAELKENGAPTETEKTDKTDADEARIVAEAAKLGEKSEQSEEKSQQQRDSRPQRGPGRGGRFTRTNNAKFDPSSQKETDDPVEIRKQVEFYFSDSNLPMDKFLLSKVGGSTNNAVPLSLLHSFKRMRRFQPFEAIVKALKDSETLELTENDTAIKRKVPLPESVNTDNNAEAVKIFEDKAMARSIYAKGFGNFGDEDSTTQLDIESFFEPYGPIKAVRLRRTQDKTFKASVFVEFADEEKQKAFLELAEKPKWKGQELVVKSKKEYCDEKVADIKAGKVFASTGRGGGRGGRGRGRGGRGRGGRGDRGDRDREDKRDWRERRDQDQKSGFKKDARGVPVVQATGEKRAREDESNGDHPAKKVDSKE